METQSLDQVAFRKTLTRVIIVPLLLMVALALMLVLQIQYLLSERRWVEHSHQVIAEAYEDEKLLLDSETGLRGYLLTGNEEFLQPYNEAHPLIGRELAELGALVSDNADQTQRLERVPVLYATWESYAQELIVKRQNGGDYLTRVNAGEGKRIMDAMRAEFVALIQTEQKLLEERSRYAERATWAVLGTSLFLALLLGWLLSLFLRRQFLLLSRSYSSAEDELKKQQKFLREVIDADPSLIFVKDWDGRFILANKAVADLYQTTTEKLVGRTDADFNASPQQVEAFIRADRSVIETGQKQFIPEESVTDARTGDVCWFQTIKTPLAARDDGALYVLGVSTDITKRKLAEESLMERDEQLRQSQKLEAVGQLAGGVAHDFNNLLTVIAGYGDLLIRQLHGNDSARRKVEEIKRAAERAAGLTRQLLAFSRRQVLQPKAIDLNALINDTGKMLRRLIGENIEFVTVLRNEAGLIFADPGQVEQVLVNLVVNARDAMPDGGKLVIQTASVELDESYTNMHVAVTPGQYVMLAVSDTGTGMDAETQARIFEPFFTTKEVGKGTGLGLSTVYGIIKQSGGNVWVYSESGKGTTFKIYFPRVAVETRAPRAVEVERAELPRGTETILLVEDEPVVRALSRTVLEDGGYIVLEASNGEEALRVCEQYAGPLHLVVTDVVMPKLGGRALVEKIAERFPDAYVLYMSGYTDEAIVHHGVLDSGTNFLEKPFTPDALLRKVREVLDKK
jgi:PAS domain S-box-containing protein